MKTLDIYFALASFSCSSPEDPEKISMALTSALVNKFPRVIQHNDVHTSPKEKSSKRKLTQENCHTYQP